MDVNCFRCQTNANVISQDNVIANVATIFSVVFSVGRV